MVYEDILLMASLEQIQPFFFAYSGARCALADNEQDVYDKKVNEASEYAEQIHQQMNWNETSPIYGDYCIKNRLNYYKLGTSDFFNHIHLLQHVADYFMNGIEHLANLSMQQRDTQMDDYMSYLANVHASLKKNECVDNSWLTCVDLLEQNAETIFKNGMICESLMNVQLQLKRILDDTKVSMLTVSGVITVLDVLGWKGIYNRQKHAIRRLQSIISLLETKVKQIGMGKDGIGDTNVLSISDTIVVITRCLPSAYNNCIDYHGELCSSILLSALKKGIPLRGAVCCGTYATMTNIFAGSAVDEAAMWHEAANWIGVCMTPTAVASYQRDGEASDNALWMNYEIPFHKAENCQEPLPHRALNWGEASPDALEFIKGIISSKTAMSESVLSKYTNTRAFLEACINAASQTPA